MEIENETTEVTIRPRVSRGMLQGRLPSTSVEAADTNTAAESTGRPVKGSTHRRVADRADAFYRRLRKMGLPPEIDRMIRTVRLLRVSLRQNAVAETVKYEEELCEQVDRLASGE